MLKRMIKKKEFQCPFVRCKFKSDILLGVEVHMVKEHKINTWIPIPYAWNILDANRYLLDAYGTRIHPSVVLRPGAVIEEPVAIDEGCIVGPNCFIRKYSSIGKNCKIGQAVEIKNSIIMDNSFVSHLYA